MPVIAILLDLGALGAYIFELQSQGFYTVGAIIQGIITLLLLVMTFQYAGKRYTRINTNFFWRSFSIRYGVIVLSFLINAVVLFLYILAVTDRNNILFQR